MTFWPRLTDVFASGAPSDRRATPEIDTAGAATSVTSTFGASLPGARRTRRASPADAVDGA